MKTRATFKGQTSQAGVFILELALVASVITLFLVFASDMVGKQTLQGHLQRLSYSAVNIIKERNQLYEQSDELNDAQVDQVKKIISQSMKRTMSSFDPNALGMHVEQLHLGTVEHQFARDITIGNDDDGIGGGSSLACRPAKHLKEMTELHLETSWGRQATLYQVTLCYKGDNWFGSVVGEDYSTVKTSSIMLGR